MLTSQINVDMGRVNIKELLLYGERLTLECKAAKNALPNAVWPTYSSFCNTVGGVMLLGIDEDLEEPDRSKRFTIKGVRNSVRAFRFGKECPRSGWIM